MRKTRRAFGFVGLYYYGTRVSGAIHIIKAVTAKCCDRLSALLLCVIPPVTEVDPKLIRQNGEFEAAHSRLVAERYGYTVAKIGSKISENKLSDVTMKTKFVPENDELVITGKSIGVSFGD